MRYLYAAYKKGAFAIQLEDGYEPKGFREALLDYIAPNFNGGWVAEYEDKPVGLILGWVRGRVIEVADMVWMPWASARNVFSSVVSFMDAMRDDFVVLEFARMDDKAFFERVAKTGVMRKVGHAHSIYEDGPAVIFETVRK